LGKTHKFLRVLFKGGFPDIEDIFVAEFLGQGLAVHLKDERI
jgi:hypothetical protein